VTYVKSFQRKPREKKKKKNQETEETDAVPEDKDNEGR